jgi:glutamate-5-semialdehyde dehydrogenase
METMEKMVGDLARRAKKAAAALVAMPTGTKNAVLHRLGELLQTEKAMLLRENRRDLLQAENDGLSPALLDRLRLDDAGIAAMAAGLAELIALADPVGKLEECRRRPNGLLVGRMRVPLGVVAMIYESRPNVTVDAAALCLKAGNAVILRGGSEAIHSNLALASLLHRALLDHGVPTDAVQVIATTDREAIGHLLRCEEEIDLVIPRGGEGLIRFVVANSRIPVLKHYKGVCHIYVDRDADQAKALPLVVNAKTQRPGVCNALEGLLVHTAVAPSFLPAMARSLAAKGVEMRGCPQSVALCPEMKLAAPDDWGREFLALILSVKIVDDYQEAREYIGRYGSRHTEAIVTENYSTAQRFVAEIDASAVLVNASTRFNDGGELGLGAEIGISTSKLHAYGPMGLEELTCRKFVVFGQGQVRG